jgi:hypothetical protein
MGHARADLAAAVAVLRQLGQLQPRPQDRDAARVYLAVAALAVALLAVEGAVGALPVARAAARVVGAAVRVAWAAGRWAGRGS